MKKKAKKKRDKTDINVYKLLTRYFLILISSLSGLFLFYYIFTPLTVYPVFWILSFFYEPNLYGTTIIVGYKVIYLIKACIAGAAFFLLFALNLSTPMKLKKRISSLLFSFAALLILNITRIVVLSFMFIEGLSVFDLTHKFLWYGLSTIFVIAIWFLTVYIFKIREIPVYSDLKQIIKLIK